MSKKIINDSLPKEGVVGINKQIVQFIQENDTWGKSDKYQQMRFETMSVGFDENDNCDWFFRITTGGHPDEPDLEKFWSVDGPEEFVNLFNEVAKRTGMNCRWKCEKYYIDNEDDEK